VVLELGLMKPKDRLLQGISVAQEIADILITRNDVQAVVLCGSLATQLTDSPEDVDINIFTVHPPPRGIEVKDYIEQKLRRLVEGLFDWVSVKCTDAQIEKWWFSDL